MRPPDILGDDYTLPCVKCTGLNGAHYLTCTTLNLVPGWYDRIRWDDEYAWDGVTGTPGGMVSSAQVIRAPAPAGESPP